MDIQKTTSQLIRAGLTQSEISKEIGRSQATVSDMAKGKCGCSRPSADVVAGLLRLLKKHKALIELKDPTNVT